MDPCDNLLEGVPTSVVAQRRDADFCHLPPRGVHKEIETFQIKRIKNLLESGQIDANTQLLHYNLFMYTIYKSSLNPEKTSQFNDLIEYMMENGAAINYRSPSMANLPGASPLSVAIVFNIPSAVKVLLTSSDLDVKQPIGPHYLTPLQYAICNPGYDAIFNLLLPKYSAEDLVQLNESDESLGTALHMAVRAKQSRFLDAMLEKNPSFDVQSPENNLPTFYKLAAGHDYKIFNNLVNKHAKSMNLNARDEFGGKHNILANLLGQGNLGADEDKRKREQLAVRLIEEFNVETNNPGDIPQLQNWAIRNAMADLVALLIRKGDFFLDDTASPLTEVCSIKCEREGDDNHSAIIVGKVLAYYAKQEVKTSYNTGTKDMHFHTLAKMNNPRSVDIAQALVADVQNNHPDLKIADLLNEFATFSEKTRLTALQLAAMRTDYPLSKYYLELGGDPNVPAENYDGKTFLHYAVCLFKPCQLEILLSLANLPHSIDLCKKTARGNTAITLLLEQRVKGHHIADTLRILLNSGCPDTKTPNKDGLTPLMLLAGWTGGSEEAIEILHVMQAAEVGKIQADWDIHAKDDQGNTALAHVVLSGPAKLFKPLIQMGADPTTRNIDRKTLKDLLEKRTAPGKTSLAEALEKARKI